MSKEILQKVVFPENEQHKAHWHLFYNADRLPYADGVLKIPSSTFVSFASYLNGCPVNKWKRYTGMDNLSVTLRACGTFTVTLVSYSLEPLQPIRREVVSKQFSLNSEEEITLQYTELNHDFYAFEIETDSECKLYGAYYSSEFDETKLNKVNLAIGTTTFRKEDYIIGNIASITRTLLEQDDELKEHLYVNVVDNGRTLSKEDIEIHDHIRLFFNDNVGGSGGFSRGMYEALHMKEEITHVLLMDDDVLILPESIRRTYMLLKLRLPEYEKAFISGTMLELDAMWVMHEDIGLVKGNKDFYHAKPIYDANSLASVMESNREIPHHDHMYAGWWYCVIPTEKIKEKGYSLPLFIRGDDCEYGLRCAPVIQTMSGICVWHMGFAGKFSAHTNYYQEFRNMLIVKAAGGAIPDVEIYGRWKQECMRSALTFDYDGWELLLMAVEDYMKGPEFIEVDRGTEILQRNKKYAEKMQPIEDIEGISTYMDEIWQGDIGNLGFLGRAKYYLTYNGQRWMSDKKLTDALGLQRQDWDHRPNRNAFHKRILTVNGIARTANIREMDRSRFKELFARQKALEKAYDAKHVQIEDEYRKAYPYLVSEEFWKKYLKLD